ASQATQKQRRVLDSLAHVETSFVLENDTSLIQPLVGFLEDTIQRVQLVDPSGMILVGVALHEALTNAIFHGNLELNSSIKERDEKEYYRLANERRGTDPFKDRRVHVTARLTREDATFIVRDEGEGFDPATLPDPTDPGN